MSHVKVNMQKLIDARSVQYGRTFENRSAGEIAFWHSKDLEFNDVGESNLDIQSIWVKPLKLDVTSNGRIHHEQVQHPRVLRKEHWYHARLDYT